jgi:hypothetical protein
VLTFVQASDIHFKGDRSSPYDLDYELRNALRVDARLVAAEIGGASGVLICGDIAFAARAGEYSRAHNWLTNLTVDLEMDSASVWVVPGNHDIQHEQIRKVPRQRNLRSTLRLAELVDLDEALREILTDSTKGPALYEPLAAYNDFAAAFGCQISPAQPYWEHRLPIADGWVLALRGMNSALISDDEDDKGDNKLVLGAMQAMVLSDEGVVHATLCHHPAEWLRDGAEMCQRLDPVAHLQVTGHVHRHEFRETDAGLHLKAGALHPERPHAEGHEPRYNWLTFTVQAGNESDALELAVRPRVWNSQSRQFTADVKEDYPDGVLTIQRTLDHQASPPEMTIARDLATPRRQLLRRLALLPLSRYNVAKGIGAPIGEVIEAPSFEVPERILVWAEQNKRLHATWERVEDAGRSETRAPNPYGSNE